VAQRGGENGRPQETSLWLGEKERSINKSVRQRQLKLRARFEIASPLKGGENGECAVGLKPARRNDN